MRAPATPVAPVNTAPLVTDIRADLPADRAFLICRRQNLGTEIAAGRAPDRIADVG